MVQLTRATGLHRAARLKRCAAKAHLHLELLEVRNLLSASPLDTLFATPTVDAAGVTSPTPYGLTPAQVRQAYGFNQITFSGGKVAGNGAGQTIAIVDAYDEPNIVSDLHTFDKAFGLADPPHFQVYKQTVGGAGPKADSNWGMEIALDVEWAHAIAPAASILLVEANTNSYANLFAAVNYARSQPAVSVISMSWGSSEFYGENYYDSLFTTPAGHQGITFVASSGDSGAPGLWPAASPNVLAVGGTTLSVASNGTYKSESAWSDSGGGYSPYESEPSFQRSVQSTGVRTIPDVAFDANPNSGFSVYDTLAISGRTGWFEVGGTSAGAPQWAALVAITDQGFFTTNRGGLTNAQISLYTLPASDFHDETSGSNGYAAMAGYDLVTGRGSPVANQIIHDLIYGVTAAQTHVSSLATVTATTTRFSVLFGLWTGSQNPSLDAPMTSSLTQPFALPAALPSVQSLGPNALATDTARPSSEGETLPAFEPGATLAPANSGLAVQTNAGATSASDDESLRPIAIAEPLPPRASASGGDVTLSIDLAPMSVVPRNGATESANVVAQAVVPTRGAHVARVRPALASDPAAVVDACFRDVEFLDASGSPLGDDDESAQSINTDMAGWSAESLAAAVAIALTRAAAVRRVGREQELSPQVLLPR